MDRQIVYPGTIPLETDLLNTNKFAMTAMAKLAMALLGSDTCLYGLHCKPDSTSSLRIQVGPGQIYSLENVDNTPYSSLAADTSQKILKQGLICESTTFELTAPSASGHSINYLVQVTYEDVDSDEIVLPYYNAANPAETYSGPGNSGMAQPGKRSGVCRLVLKTGEASLTGSQVTPQPDPGFVAAWAITVTAGMKAIMQDSILRVQGAPFLPEDGIIAAVQQGRLNSGEAESQDDNYHLVCQPPVTKLTDGMRLYFRTSVTNTGACKLRVGELASYPIYDNASRELIKGALDTHRQNEVEWNEALKAWVLCNNQLIFDWDEMDRRYIPVSGGRVKGPLTVEGPLETDRAVKIGKAEVTTQGDLTGEAWGGSLHSWLTSRSASFVQQAREFPLAWKDPVSKLIIQGGLYKGNKGEIKYPVAFPSYCFLVLITQCGKHKMSKDNSFVAEVNTQSFTLNAGHGEPSFYWLAMGC